MSENPVRITVEQRVSNKYTILLNRDITAPDDFTEELQLLGAATEDDEVVLQLSTYGGQLDTCVALVTAISQCRAPVYCEIGQVVASAGTAIALACANWGITSQSTFMIHTATMAFYGKASDLSKEYPFRMKMLRRWVEDTYYGFLTAEECERVIAGEDFWFEGEELAERFSAYASFRNTLMDAIDNEEEAA